MQGLRTKYQIDVGRAFLDAFAFLRGDAAAHPDDDVRPSEDSLVRKAKDDEAFGPKPVVPGLVLRLSQGMNAAIRLDVEVIEARLTDTGAAWQALTRPSAAPRNVVLLVIVRRSSWLAADRCRAPASR